MKEKCSRVRQGTPVKFSHDRIKRLVDESSKIVEKKLLEAHKIKTKGGPV